MAIADQCFVSAQKRLGHLDDQRLALAPQHEIGAEPYELVTIDRRVEAEKSRFRPRVVLPNPRENFDAQPKGRVHRNRDGHELRAKDERWIELLHGRIDVRRRKPRPLEE